MYAEAAIPTTPARRADNLPFTHQPRTAQVPALAPREQLEADAAALYSSRMLEAKTGYKSYAVVAYDPVRRVAYVRYDSVVNTNAIYQVNMTNDRCDCPDCGARVGKMNRRLAAAGMLPFVTCKHAMIVALKMDPEYGNDPDLLTRALHPRDLSPEYRRAIVSDDGYNRPRRPISAEQMRKDFD
jgi:hypothetical protein